MKLVCKKTFEDWVHGYGSKMFYYHEIYEAEEHSIAPLYANGDWYSRSEFFIKVGSIPHKVDRHRFYLIEEWRELQLKKVLDV